MDVNHKISLKGKKNFYKAKISMVLAVSLAAVTIFNSTISAKEVEFVTDGRIKSGNLHHHDYYGNYGHTVESQLVKNDDGTFSRIELVDGNIVEEVYSSTFSFIRQNLTPLELPEYGGVYASGNYYFVVEGQSNYEELSGMPEFRIIKYSKDWKRIASTDITDANTVMPFDAGSCSFSESDGKLYIRTCHKMYKSKDGLNHQANVTIHVDMETCTVGYIMKDVANVNYGYVSHSFNQFVENHNGMVYACDHGDAYPRGCVITRYNPSQIKDNFWDNKNEYVIMMPFEGGIGDNYTGAMIGGMTVTTSSAIVAGTIKCQEINDVFISTVPVEDFNGSAVNIRYITDYKQHGKESASNPYLVSVTDNKYLLVWETYKLSETESNICQQKINYLFLDDNGEPVSNVQSFAGCLSGCKPVVSDGNIVWYSTGKIAWKVYGYYNKEDTSPVFYTMPIESNELDRLEAGYQFEKDGMLFEVIDGSSEEGKVRLIKPVKYSGDGICIPRSVTYSGRNYIISDVSSGFFNGMSSVDISNLADIDINLPSKQEDGKVVFKWTDIYGKEVTKLVPGGFVKMESRSAPDNASPGSNSTPKPDSNITPKPGKTPSPMITPEPGPSSNPVTSPTPVTTSSPELEITPEATSVPDKNPWSGIFTDEDWDYDFDRDNIFGNDEDNSGINSANPSKEPANPDKVKAPKVKAVKEKSIKFSYKNNKLILKWKKVTGANGYEVQISNKKKFNKLKTGTVKKTKYTIKKPKISKDYYIRIRAYKNYKASSGKKKSYSKWIVVKVKFK